MRSSSVTTLRAPLLARGSATGLFRCCLSRQEATLTGERHTTARVAVDTNRLSAYSRFCVVQVDNVVDERRLESASVLIDQPIDLIGRCYRAVVHDQAVSGELRRRGSVADDLVI